MVTACLTLAVVACAACGGVAVVLVPFLYWIDPYQDRLKIDGLTARSKNAAERERHTRARLDALESLTLAQGRDLRSCESAAAHERKRAAAMGRAYHVMAQDFGAVELIASETEADDRAAFHRFENEGGSTPASGF